MTTIVVDERGRVPVVYPAGVLYAVPYGQPGSSIPTDDVQATYDYALRLERRLRALEGIELSLREAKRLASQIRDLRPFDPTEGDDRE